MYATACTRCDVGGDAEAMTTQEAMTQEGGEGVGATCRLAVFTLLDVTIDGVNFLK